LDSCRWHPAHFGGTLNGDEAFGADIGGQRIKRDP
jgi:hypothetical protein